MKEKSICVFHVLPRLQAAGLVGCYAATCVARNQEISWRSISMVCQARESRGDHYWPHSTQVSTVPHKWQLYGISTTVSLFGRDSGIYKGHSQSWTTCLKKATTECLRTVGHTINTCHFMRYDIGLLDVSPMNMPIGATVVNWTHNVLETVSSGIIMLIHLLWYCGHVSETHRA